MKPGETSYLLGRQTSEEGFILSKRQCQGKEALRSPEWSLRSIPYKGRAERGVFMGTETRNLRWLTIVGQNK